MIFNIHWLSTYILIKKFVQICIMKYESYNYVILPVYPGPKYICYEWIFGDIADVEVYLHFVRINSSIDFLRKCGVFE
jgi:hypothetical protein